MLALWFGFTEPVDRRTYLGTGVGLMAAKYALDATLVYLGTQRLYGPLTFFNPLFSARHEAISPAPEWLLTAMIVVALPFAWIGASMSMRRAVDAGWSPWVSLLFFVPGVNYLLMLALCLAASRAAPLAEPGPVVVDQRLRSAAYGVAAAVGLAIGMTGFSVYGLKEYGWSLFFLCPVLMGVVSSYLHNRRFPRGAGETVLLAVASVAVAGGLLLLFAIEGVLCLAMAAPFAFALALLGAFLGRSIALMTRKRGSLPPLVVSVLSLFVVAAAEGPLRDPIVREVTTALEIEAPPEQVWSHVIAFAPLDPPSEWIFKAGVAYPIGATIAGTGPGAIRRCEFSTGPFIEPITVWDEPRRLGFDVVKTPPSMAEWSPYRDLNAPHLEGYMVSKRGEFRLIPLAGGRTRLEGSTFYTLDIAPEIYWRPWAEWLLHAIHRRVLVHIKAHAEAAASASSNKRP